MCEKFGIDWAVPSLNDEQSLMNIIYNQVKAGKEVNLTEFIRIIENMKAEGCDAVVLGCTELSVINKDFELNRDDVIDSLEVLAKRSIELCGKKVKVI